MTRSTRARLLGLTSLFVLVAACGGVGDPDTYADTDVQDNFARSCEDALERSEVDLPDDYCQCTFDAFESEVPFDLFLAFDRRVRDTIADIDDPDDLRRAAASVTDQYNAENEDSEGFTPVDVDVVDLMTVCEGEGTSTG
jgi:hypothetical protein